MALYNVFVQFQIVVRCFFNYFITIESIRTRQLLKERTILILKIIRNDAAHCTTLNIVTT